MARSVASIARATVALVQNLFTYSEDFSNAAWPTTGFTVTANDAANPVDGAVTADRITSVSAANILSRIVTNASPAPKTYTVYVKNGTMAASGWNQGFVVYNASTATSLVTTASIAAGSGATVNGSFTIVDVGGGWFRIDITVTAGWRPGQTLVYYFGASGVIPAGQYFWIWGAQLTNANWSGPYVATTSAAVNDGNIRSRASKRTTATTRAAA